MMLSYPGPQVSLSRSSGLRPAPAGSFLVVGCLLLCRQRRLRTAGRRIASDDIRWIVNDRQNLVKRKMGQVTPVTSCPAKSRGIPGKSPVTKDTARPPVTTRTSARRDAGTQRKSPIPYNLRDSSADTIMGPAYGSDYWLARAEWRSRIRETLYA